jgi:hypothetical protein
VGQRERIAARRQQRGRRVRAERAGQSIGIQWAGRVRGVVDGVLQLQA